MKPRVYIETTVPSYLAAWPSRDVIRSSHQHLTREWWLNRRGAFDLFVSQIVLRECQAGDKIAGQSRMEYLRDLQVLDESPEVTALARGFIELIPLPQRAVLDAMHIAIATCHGMDYLLTWNCAHIANAMFRSKIVEICHSFDKEAPVICTPEELMARGDE